ncbi:beta-lactamase family protein [Massilia solisilvae]|uniref:Beta-lactamase family protein n=1 Tax=Massilia solisilvae TaxID=1811225 RepID=A0ABT2BMY7_9BURK|nr:beta-lactamase family protein [Massilia solisilvae]MCS0609883.1 beta-lactamase family protein [Massilia solisilvae]
MKQVCNAILAAVLMTGPAAAWAAAPAASQQASALAPEQQVDALFAKWNKPDTPGCAVTVIRDGKVLLRKGYGMADIERAVPVSPATVFNVGSMSKQFTAFSIYLLAKDGKLSLDDDVHKYLPEVPDFGKTITLRHLLQHTSGLRDAMNLMVLAGWRLDDVMTMDDMLGIIRRQRALNFAPGQEYMYSNTGYTLLAAIVQRVSGKPLAVFAKERIFDPLGMTHTAFQKDYGTLVPRRALSYQAAPDGSFKYLAVGESTAGPGGLLTTVEDLALWDANFYDGRVGGKDLLAQMQVTGVLNNGKPIQYASGLMVENYRGARLVEHSGGIGGYASQMSRFPEQHFTVAVLANTPGVSPTVMARRIADIYLGAELAPKAAPADSAMPAEIALDPARLDAFLGYYALSPTFGVTFTKEDGHLVGQGTGQAKGQLFASGEREFFAKVVNARFSFEEPDKDGIVQGFVLHQNGRDIPGKRTAKPTAPPASLKAYAGEYYNDELHVLYTVFEQDGKLMVAHPRTTIKLDYVGKDAFVSDFFGTEIRYQCSPDAGCTGFTLNFPRARNLQFSKVAIVAPGARAAADTGIFLEPDSTAVAKAGKASPAS